MAKFANFKEMYETNVKSLRSAAPAFGIPDAEVEEYLDRLTICGPVYDRMVKQFKVTAFAALKVLDGTELEVCPMGEAMDWVSKDLPTIGPILAAAERSTAAGYAYHDGRHILYINLKLVEKMAMWTLEELLVHERQHYLQAIEGRMAVPGDGTVIWEGKVYPLVPPHEIEHRMCEYLNSPWEVEARQVASAHTREVWSKGRVTSCAL